MKDYKITYKNIKGATRIIVETNKEAEERIQKKLNQEAYLKLMLFFIAVTILTIILN